jgi:hypothetical protein
MASALTVAAAASAAMLVARLVVTLKKGIEEPQPVLRT